jgi:hypothetical protein
MSLKSNVLAKLTFYAQNKSRGSGDQVGSFLKKKNPEVQNLIQALEKISVEKSWNLSMGRIATLVSTIIFYRSCTVR